MSQRDSYDYCQATCPDVDHLFELADRELKQYLAPYVQRDVTWELEKLRDQVKAHATERLRAGLIKACDEADALDLEVATLKARIERLTLQVAELTREPA